MSTLTINVTLRPDFLANIARVIDDEIAIAERKWNRKLTEEEKSVVRKSAHGQLRSKVSALAHKEWDLGSKFTILASSEGAPATMNIREDSKPRQKISFILNKNGWMVTREESDAVRPIGEFFAHLNETMETWVRTATFYAVGSYASN